jgi:hypothetical protein
LRVWSMILLAVQLLILIFGVFSVSNTKLFLKKEYSPCLFVFLDVSASMNVLENDDGKIIPRIELAKKTISEEIKNTDKNKSIALFTVSDELKLISLPSKNRKKVLSKLSVTKAGYSSYNEDQIASELKTFIEKNHYRFDALFISDGAGVRTSNIEKILNGKISYRIVGRNRNILSVSNLRITSGNKAVFTVLNESGTARATGVELEYNGKVIGRKNLRAVSGVNYFDFSSDKLDYGRYKIKLISDEMNVIYTETYYAYNNPYRIKVMLIGGENPYIDSLFDERNFEVSRKGKLDEKTKKYDSDLVVSNNEKIDIGLKNNLIVFGDFKENKHFAKDTKIDGVLYTSDKALPELRFIKNDPLGYIAGSLFSLKENSMLNGIFYINDRLTAASSVIDGYKKIVSGFDISASGIGGSEIFPIFINNAVKDIFPQWDNPFAYNITIGKEYKVYYDGKFKNIKNSFFYAYKKGQYVYFKAYKPGFYPLELGSKIDIASNVDVEEYNTAPAEIARTWKNDSAALSANERKTDLSDYLLIVFILFLILEWFLWNTSFFTNRGKG